MAIQYDITMPQGVTKVIPFKVTVLTDPTLPFDQTTNPRIPLDLTTAALQCQVRQTYNTSNELLTITDQNGKFVKTNAAGGEFEMRLVPSDTNEFRFGGESFSYLYDIEAKFSENNVIRIAQGSFIISREITRI